MAEHRISHACILTITKHYYFLWHFMTIWGDKKIKNLLSADSFHPISSKLCGILNFFITTLVRIVETVYYFPLTVGSILKPLAGKFSEDTRKKGKGAKTGTPQD